MTFFASLKKAMTMPPCGCTKKRVRSRGKRTRSKRTSKRSRNKKQRGGFIYSYAPVFHSRSRSKSRSKSRPSPHSM